jgi:glycosyltransferase involved in cell wall biosynthesis
MIAVAARPTCDTIQLGLGWFPEQPGGANRYYHDLVSRLPGAGVTVTGLVAGSDRVERDSGGVVRAFAPATAPIGRRLAALRRAGAAVVGRRARAGVASHFALYVAPILDLLRGEQLVVHFHGPWADESGAEGSTRPVVAAKRMVERLVYRRAARVIAISTAFGQVLTERYRVIPERIRIIPGGVSVDRFATNTSRSDARRALDWPGDRPVLLSVRRLVRRMGLVGLIEAARIARTRVPDLLVLIAGTGPLREELEQRIEAAGLQDHVRLVGRLSDDRLPIAYRAADLTVVPSIAWEGFGLVAVESLAAGTPALVTPVGGLPSTVEDLAPQCIVDSRPEALSAAIAAAVRGELPLPTPDQCVQHARRRFDWPVVIERIAGVYREVAA